MTEEDMIREYIGLDKDSPSGLVWLKKRGARGAAGAPALACLSKRRGYYTGRFNGRSYEAHRVVYLLHYGEWPTVCDHIDTVRTNNNPENLRSVTKYGNACNRSAAKGWIYRNDKYVARITVHGVKRTIGRFDSAEAAHSAYIQAKRELHIPCALTLE